MRYEHRVTLDESCLQLRGICVDSNDYVIWRVNVEDQPRAVFDAMRRAERQLHDAAIARRAALVPTGAVSIAEDYGGELSLDDSKRSEGKAR